MRSCWNWQTGMTKDHVSLRRVGSSPILRIYLVVWLLETVATLSVMPELEGRDK